MFTTNEKKVIGWIKEAEDSTALVILTMFKTMWCYGDLWVNHLTAKSLERKGVVTIEWSPYSDDDTYVNLVEVGV